MSAASKSPCIMVTGAGGFVGRWLMQRLGPCIPPGGRLVQTHRGDLGGASDAVWLDVADREQADEVIRSVRPTCVIHLAAVSLVHEARHDPRHAWRVNLCGTMNLAQAVLAHVPKARFILASTSEVYGGTFRELNKPLDESARLDPANAYAASKAAGDLLVGQMARDGLKAIRFRPFNHTGPGQGDQFVIPAIASQIARIEAGQQDVLRVGNLEAQRDFLDVRDVVDAYSNASLMRDELEPGTIVNLASGVPRRIGDILDALIAKAGVAVRVEQDPARLRPSDTPVAVGDASFARNKLKWSPRISWDETLDDVMEDWRTIVRSGPDAPAPNRD